MQAAAGGQGAERVAKKSGALCVLLLLVVVAAMAAVGLFISWQASERIRADTERPEAVHPADHVDAVITLLDSDEPDLDDKNRAIWILGDAGDPHPLPALRALDRGEPCDHARCVCQDELRKAVDNTQGRRCELPGPTPVGSFFPNTSVGTPRACAAEPEKEVDICLNLYFDI